jgi:hypothetical protein
MKTAIRFFSKILPLLTNIFLFPMAAHAQWSTPVSLSPSAVSAALNESMGSCLGASGDSLHVVWTDKLSTTNAVIYYTRSLDTGLTWSAPVAISNIGGNAWNPAIAVNGRNVHVVWREVNPVNNHRASYYMHSLDGGSTWSPAVFLDSTADWPAVAVSGNIVYVANDLVTAASPYNTEIFFLRSLDNGATWSSPQQLTFAVNRSEDEAIAAQGSHVHMSWNDKRSGQFQILYKESSDYGVTWGPDVVVDPQYDYSTMVSVDGANVDVVAAGRSINNHYQILLTQSADTGATWATNRDITNDTLNTYFYPYMVRNGSDLHIVTGGSSGAKYLHSADGGATWDAPYSFTGSSTFIAYTGCALHILYLNNVDHHVYYIRNPNGNAGHCGGVITEADNFETTNSINIFPNPFNDQININSSEEPCLISIYNSLGKIIFLQKTNSLEQQIDLSKQPAGIFFLQINSDNGIQRMKIVKE